MEMTGYLAARRERAETDRTENGDGKLYVRGGKGGRRDQEIGVRNRKPQVIFYSGIPQYLHSGIFMAL